MIPRYSLPEISEIWTDKNKYDLWQEIEVLYCEGMAQIGIIPKKDARTIRKKADFNIRRVLQIEKKTRAQAHGKRRRSLRQRGTNNTASAAMAIRSDSHIHGTRLFAPSMPR